MQFEFEREEESVIETGAKRCDALDHGADRGFVCLYTDGGVMTAAIWAPDISVISQSEEHPSETQIQMKTGTWYRAYADVTEVYNSVRKANTLARADAAQKAKTDSRVQRFG